MTFCSEIILYFYGIKQKERNVWPIIKKAVHIIKYLLLVLILLFLLIVGAVNLPVVHKAITKKTNSILRERGIPVQVGKITLLLNGKIGINELAMIEPPHDTIIYIGKLKVNLSPLPLLSNKIFINEIILNDAVINIVRDTITDKLQIISAFNPTGKENEKLQADSTKINKTWDINARTIQLKNIRFLYSDFNGGILVKEKLDEAKIDLDKFSLIDKQVDVKSIEINKPAGVVSVWQGKEKPEKVTAQNSPWVFTAKTIEINDVIFALEQPDFGQRIDVTLKNGNFSLQKMELETQKILVDQIGLKQPEVTFLYNEKILTDTLQKESSETFSIPYSPWTIISERLNIVDGKLDYTTSTNGQTTSLDRRLQINKLNASFDKTWLSPKDYSLNLEEVSFNLDSTLVIDSGSINFELDSLQSTTLQINLSALLKDKKGWFTKKQSLNFNAKIVGNTSSLQIKEMGILSTTGLKFNVTGNVQ